MRELVQFSLSLYIYIYNRFSWLILIVRTESRTGWAFENRPTLVYITKFGSPALSSCVWLWGLRLRNGLHLGPSFAHKLLGTRFVVYLEEHSPNATTCGAFWKMRSCFPKCPGVFFAFKNPVIPVRYPPGIVRFDFLFIFRP